MMENVSLTDHAIGNVTVIAVLAILDWLVFSPLAKRRCKKNRDITSARWFFIHAAANFVVVVLSMRSIIAVCKDPLHSMDVNVYKDRSVWSPASRWPLTVINSVHIYHMLGGFRLSSDDYFHHAMFIPTLGFPGQYFNFGPLGPWLGFFISGLPGGIDYLMLGLVKIGLLSRVLEKRINANLNTWCRCPGILVSTILFSQAVLYDLYDHSVPTFFIVLYIVLPPYNGIYYGRQAVSNYTVNFIKENIMDVYMSPKYRLEPSTRARSDSSLKIHTRTSKVTGQEVVDWKRIIQDLGREPQRGS